MSVALNLNLNFKKPGGDTIFRGQASRHALAGAGERDGLGDETTERIGAWKSINAERVKTLTWGHPRQKRLLQFDMAG